MFEALKLYREHLKEWHTALDGDFSGCDTVSSIKKRHIYICIHTIQVKIILY